MPHTLTLANGFRSMPQIDQALKRLLDRIEAMSGGRLVIAVHGHHQAFPASQNLTAVADGRLDMAFSAPSYWESVDPAFAIFAGAVPFGMGPIEHLAWIDHGGGRELQLALFARYGVVSMPAGLISSESGGWFRAPVADIGGLAGRKLRFFGLGCGLISSEADAR